MLQHYLGFNRVFFDLPADKNNHSITIGHMGHNGHVM